MQKTAKLCQSLLLATLLSLASGCSETTKTDDPSAGHIDAGGRSSDSDAGSAAADERDGDAGQMESDSSNQVLLARGIACTTEREMVVAALADQTATGRAARECIQAATSCPEINQCFGPLWDSLSATPCGQTGSYCDGTDAVDCDNGTEEREYCGFYGGTCSSGSCVFPTPTCDFGAETCTGSVASFCVSGQTVEVDCSKAVGASCTEQELTGDDGPGTHARCGLPLHCVERLGPTSFSSDAFGPVEACAPDSARADEKGACAEEGPCCVCCDDLTDLACELQDFGRL
jgi:hypothetical protein